MCRRKNAGDGGWIYMIFLSFVDGFMVNQLEVSYENSGFTHEISMVIIQLIFDILISLDWFKGKSTGNHGFYH